MKSFVYYKCAHSFHQGPLNKHKVVKKCGSYGAEYKIKMQMRLNPDILSSMDQYHTSQIGSVHLRCGVSPQRQAGNRGPRGTKPKQDADDDT